MSTETMAEGLAVLFTQARVQLDNKLWLIDLGHDYNMEFSIPPREC